MIEETIFAKALEIITPADRSDYVQHACGGDLTLLQRAEALLRAHEQSDDFLDLNGGSEPTVEYAGAASSAAVDAPSARPWAEGPGSQIGAYTLLQKLPEGGMGTVWVAQQEGPIRRKVALKVIKLGMDTAQVIARFQADAPGPGASWSTPISPASTTPVLPTRDALFSSWS